jgi:hypothetical protein
MVKRLMFLVVVSVVVALGATIAVKANAGPNGKPDPCSFNGNVAFYSVKFTCGQQSSTDDDVVTGVYRTNINIHNPQNQTVNFCTKVVLPDDATDPFPHGVTNLAPQSLSSDHGLFIDCYTPEPASISSQMTNNTPPFTVPPITSEFEGFVVIEVPQTSKNPTLLDVVGKYTARPGGSAGSASDVSSLQIVVYSPTVISNGHND